MRGGTYMLTHVHLFVLPTVNRPYKLNIHTVLYCPPFCSVVLYMPPPQFMYISASGVDSILQLSSSHQGQPIRPTLCSFHHSTNHCPCSSPPANLGTPPITAILLAFVLCVCSAINTNRKPKSANLQIRVRIPKGKPKRRIFFIQN